MSELSATIRLMNWIDFVEFARIFARIVVPDSLKKPLKLLVIFACLLAPTYVAWAVGLYAEAYAERLLNIVARTLVPTVVAH